MSANAMLILALATCAACAALDSTTSINRCVPGSTCTIKGMIVTSEQVGSIRDETGCISVALPKFVNDSWDHRNVRASGHVYRIPDYPGLTTYKLRDRTIDVEACFSGLAMYVDEIHLEEKNK